MFYHNKAINSSIFTTHSYTLYIKKKKKPKKGNFTSLKHYIHT